MRKFFNVKVTFQFFILFCFLCFFSITIFAQYNSLNRANNKLDEINSEIEKEKLTHERLDKEKNHSKSDEFIEKIARDRLGLIKSDEIIFDIKYE